MSTFIINLNDTMAVSDSLIMELAKVMNTCQPCIQETETSCNDVKIVAIICITIVLVALIAKWAIWSWQNAAITSKEQERKDKDEKEVAEYKRKQEANKTSRDWQLEDEKRKRQYALDDEALKRKNAIEDEERKRAFDKDI